LAVLNYHTGSVNTVRWNNVGTMFASGSDDDTIILWEYKGLKTISEFERL
jgi:WD40 repeat protein